MKKIIIYICSWLKSHQYLIYFSISMLLLDVYLRFVNRTMKSFSIFELVPNIFTVLWILIMCLIIYTSNKTLKKVFTISFFGIFTILQFTNLLFSRIFSKFFMFKDLLYSGEGIEFINSIFLYIKPVDVIVVLVGIAFIVLSIFTQKFISKENKKTKVITIVISGFLIITLFATVQILIGKSKPANHWNAFSVKRNIYNQFNDSKRALMLCGLYEYSFRDFYLTFLKFDSKDYDEYHKEIDKFIKNNNNKNTSQYNGKYKDKNLIFIMLENIDTWMINENAMPVLYNLKKNSIDFTEHYSIAYSSGATFNTEFVANTGIIPSITELRTAYSYNLNNYSYSLANLFKKAGYKVNSIHKNNGQFYNRDNIHIAWGYENHYNKTNININGNIDLDTVLVSENIDKIIYSEKFMTFYITYSAHMPFAYTKNECKENIEYIKNKFNSKNEEFLCAMSQAKVTDDSIKIIIDKLKDEKIFEDTVIVFFTDHYAYSMNEELIMSQKNETDKDLLNKVPFFIYDGGKTQMEVAKVNSNIDILPTIADLFGLSYNPSLYLGNSIFAEDFKEIVPFSDGTWYDGKIKFNSDYKDKITDYILETNEYVNNTVLIGGKIIESDYFRYYNSLKKNK